MVFFGYAFHVHFMYYRTSWTAIILGTLVLISGFAYSYWQYNNMKDDYEESDEYSDYE